MPDNQLLLDKEHIQILQDRFFHVTDLSIICLDRDRSPLTRVSLCEGEPDSIAELLQSDYLQTLLTNFRDMLRQSGSNYYELLQRMNEQTGRAAQLFLGLVPVLVVYPFVQKYFTTGLVMGSVKG